MFQFDVYVLFFDITVTNYCIKVFYELDLLDSLRVCVRVSEKQSFTFALKISISKDGEEKVTIDICTKEGSFESVIKLLVSHQFHYNILLFQCYVSPPG